MGLSSEHLFPAVLHCPTDMPSIGVHDVGGYEDTEPLDLAPHTYSYWERSIHALMGLLVKKRLFTLDEHRRATECLPAEAYAQQTYYEKWASAICALLVERGVLTKAELDAELGLIDPTTTIKFHTGDIVRVKAENSAIRWRKPHLRTPGYVHGLVGTIERKCQGCYANPEALAFREDAPKQPLYRVRFFQRDVWEQYKGAPDDTIDVEIYQPWLEAATPADLQQQHERSSTLHSHPHPHPHPHHHHDNHHAHSHHEHELHDHDHDHSHDHSHDHNDHEAVIDHGDHVHEGRTVIEQRAVDLEGPATDGAQAAEALLRAVQKKCLVTADELRKAVEVLDSKGTQQLGARIVAKAWTDPAFKARLLEDANAAVAAEFGTDASNWPARQDVGAASNPKETYGTVLTVVENTPTTHNLIVCTLCSCYPIAVLGLSPPWYKSRSYRARAVRDPRGVLREFGLELPEDVAIRVHDSTAENRYLVLPQRPEGTEGWSEEQLHSLVGRDSMIGVARAETPAELQAEV